MNRYPNVKYFFLSPLVALTEYIHRYMPFDVMTAS